jgi:hypothetical protein
MKNTLNEFMGTDLEKQNRANDPNISKARRAYACGSVCGKYTLDWIGLMLFGLIYIVMGSLILAMDIQAKQFFKAQEDLGDKSLCLKTFGDSSNYVPFIDDGKVTIDPKSLVDLLLTFNVIYMFWSVMYCISSFTSIFATCTEKEQIIRHFKNNNSGGHYGGGGDDEDDQYQPSNGLYGASSSSGSVYNQSNRNPHSSNEKKW